jgi:hypothetical protein
MATAKMPKNATVIISVNEFAYSMHFPSQSPAEPAAAKIPKMMKIDPKTLFMIILPSQSKFETQRVDDLPRNISHLHSCQNTRQKKIQPC